ncbi:acetylcholine receptor subunit beta-type acr-2-like [Babylonia areolata]|uniref:acetylcholine receptor subunit beta-type acr-2-like n=1 Tax=Babylonia areolata TaxID=304850 RepID=UPI003FD378C3
MKTVGAGWQLPSGLTSVLVYAQMRRSDYDRQSFPGNSSGFIGEHSRRRQAYYHWRDWLMQHPAVVQKVPPVPKTNNLDAGMDLFVRLSPFVVLEVDDSRQTISMSSKLEFMWTDPSLALTPELVEMFTDGNASSLPFSVSVPRQVLWAPPVIMVEGISDLSVLEAFSEATINQNGSVYVDLPRILTLTCPFNMIDYPFDEHYCPITFFDISITSNIYPLAWDQNFSKQLSINGEWVLVSVSNNTIHIPPERIVYTQYVLHLRRKTAYYTVMILMPMVMTSYLNVLVFLLPPDLGDKASYLVTLTISLSVFTSFFNTDMPRGVDSTPTIFILLIYVNTAAFAEIVVC